MLALLQCKPNTFLEKGGASAHEYVVECTLLLYLGLKSLLGDIGHEWV